MLALPELHDLGAVAFVYVERAGDVFDVFVGDSSAGENGEATIGIGDEFAQAIEVRDDGRAGASAMGEDALNAKIRQDIDGVLLLGAFKLVEGHVERDGNGSGRGTMERDTALVERCLGKPNKLGSEIFIEPGSSSPVRQPKTTPVTPRTRATRRSSRIMSFSASVYTKLPPRGRIIAITAMSRGAQYVTVP